MISRAWTRLDVGLGLAKRILLLAPILLPASGCSATSPPRCFVHVPVYDAHGNRLDFSVVAVTPEGERSIDLRTIARKEYRVVVRGDRIHFSEVWIGKRPIEITLEDRNGHRIVRLVALTGCQQRTSLRHGELDSGADVA